MTCKISAYTILITSTSDIQYQNVSVVFKATNPANTRPTDPFLVYTERDFSKNGTYYIIDQNLVNLTYKINTSTQFLDSSMVRLPMTSNQLGYQTGQPTQIIVYAKLRHALQSTASFVIQFPEKA